MAWVRLDRLISISRRRGLDPRRIEVYLPEEHRDRRARHLDEDLEPSLISDEEYEQIEEDEDYEGY